MSMHRLICLLVFTAGAVSAAFSQMPKPDLIVYHGKIVTVDADFSTVEAMAVTGDRIAAVGSNEKILALAGPQTRRIDLHGRTVLPGLIDSHLHAVDSAMYEFDHPVPEMETINDVLQYLRQRAAALQAGQWVTLAQVFITRLKEQRYPTRQELDGVAPRILSPSAPDPTRS